MRLRGERGKISPSPTTANKNLHSDRGAVCIASKLFASESHKQKCSAGAAEAGFDCTPRERKGWKSPLFLRGVTGRAAGRAEQAATKQAKADTRPARCLPFDSKHGGSLVAKLQCLVGSTERAGRVGVDGWTSGLVRIRAVKGMQSFQLRKL